MKKHDSIQKVMTTNPITVQQGQKLSEVSAIFRQHNIHHIPVLEQKRPVGMIAETDLLRLVYDAGHTDSRLQDSMMDQQHSISQVMNEKLATLEVSATVRDAAELLSDSTRHSLLIINEGELAGIVTTTDLIRYLSDQF